MQTIGIGVLVGGSVVEIKLAPSGVYGPVLFASLTAYTRRLAELGRVYIRAQT